jgi:hypothetical protein
MWPAEREGYTRLITHSRINSYGEEERRLYYDALIRREFQDLGLIVLQCEETTQLLPMGRRDGVGKVKDVKRHLLKVSLYAYPKAPDPVLSFWQKFRCWISSEPYPRTPEPPRITQFYDLTTAQFEAFIKIYREL